MINGRRVAKLLVAIKIFVVLKIIYVLDAEIFELYGDVLMAILSATGLKTGV